MTYMMLPRPEGEEIVEGGEQVLVVVGEHSKAVPEDEEFKEFTHYGYAAVPKAKDAELDESQHQVNFLNSLYFDVNITYRDLKSA